MRIHGWLMAFTTPVSFFHEIESNHNLIDFWWKKISKKLKFTRVSQRWDLGLVFLSYNLNALYRMGGPIALNHVDLLHNIWCSRRMYKTQQKKQTKKNKKITVKILNRVNTADSKAIQQVNLIQHEIKSKKFWFYKKMLCWLWLYNRRPVRKSCLSESSMCSRKRSGLEEWFSARDLLPLWSLPLILRLLHLLGRPFFLLATEHPTSRKNARGRIVPTIGWIVLQSHWCARLRDLNHFSIPLSINLSQKYNFNSPKKK